METATLRETPLGMSRVLDSTFDQAINAVTAALKDQGFGILSDIDVAATLKARLGTDMEPYRILGACNPQLAHQALDADRSIGLLLPCNVVVREVTRGVEVSIADPEAVFSLAPSENMGSVAGLPAEARQRLSAALASLA
ncbi:MAG: DUF302 domain-containing protein [Trueperaceae bacterium]